MDAQQIKALVNNGLIITYHAKEKMQSEKITETDIKEVLLSGLSSRCDNSNRNDKSFAHNVAIHNTLTYKGLTVVFCDSKEHACLIISVYHGKVHDFMSNPYNRQRYFHY